MNDQLVLDLRPPLARNADPDTSKKAAADALRFQKSHAGRIYIALVGMRDGGTFYDIALATGLRDSQVWKRLPEMHGLAKPKVNENGDEVEVRGPNGSLCRVWIAII